MAKDIVTILHDYSVANDFRFAYGNKEVLNLLQSNSADFPDKVHLLVENVKGSTKRNKGITGISIEKIVYTGRYFLVLPSDFSVHRFNENEKDINDSQYKLQIEPLRAIFMEMDRYLSACEGYSIKVHDFDYLHNFLDINLTGLLIQYNIEVYE